MKSYQTVLNENGTQIHSLSESDDLIIIRTKDMHDPFDILFDADIFSDLDITYLDFYPEASVHTLRINNSNARSLRRVLKDQVRAIKHKNLSFIGSLYIDINTGHYQIYTGNLYIQFVHDLSEQDCQKFLEEHHFKLKFNVKFATNGYFVSVEEKVGKDIFDVSIAMLSKDIVIICQPELVVKRRSIRKEMIQHTQSSYSKWISQRVNIPESWQLTKGEGINICIIDDGLDFDHPAFDFGKKVVKYRDFFSSDINEKPTHKSFTEYHGTAVASICCSSDSIAYGVAPEANLMIARVKGIGSMLEAVAFRWAADEGADIINCSWGPYDGRPEIIGDEEGVFPMPDYTKLAINYAHDFGRKGKGALIFFAAGNGREPMDYDGYASYPGVFAIGASNRYDEPSYYSDYGNNLFCLFPSSDVSFSGNRLETTYGTSVADRLGKEGFHTGDFYHLFGGTSSAAPAVAGIAALMLSLAPQLNRIQARTILKESCTLPDHISTNKHPSYGYGIINAMDVINNTQEFLLNTHKTQSMTHTAISLHIGINDVNQEIYQHRFSNLSGCINDAKTMEEIAQSFGYKSSHLYDEQATKHNIIEKLNEISSKLKEGDIFLLSYAGHGASIVDMDSDESDRKDESWVLYDNIILDDELYELYTQFAKGVRIIVVSDSCHSGTVLRAMKNRKQLGQFQFAENEFRVVPQEAIQEIYDRNKKEFREAKERIKNLNVEASIILLAACQDHQLAQESGGHGLFTSHLSELLRDENSYTYSELIEEMSINLLAQTPNLDFEGIRNTEFENQSVFSTDFQRTEKVDPTPAVDLNTQPQPIQQIPVVTQSLLISVKDSHIPLTSSSRTPENNRIVNNEIPALTNSFSSQWDEAYQLFLDNPETITFIEPEVIFTPYAIFNEKSRSGNTAYLKHYPEPQISDGVKNRFTWHLEEKFSQLKKAHNAVFIGEEPQHPLMELDEKIKIAQIDTGYIFRHPLLPEFLAVDASRSFIPSEGSGPAIDHDIDSFQEQDGHGNATLAILAGGFVNVNQNGDRYSGLFGAIPFAHIFPLRISNTVALFSGRRFSKAVNYAVDTLKVDVITMSMAGIPSKVMARAVNHAYENGVVIVSAGGNSWAKGAMKLLPKNLMYPARFDRVIAVTGAAYDEKPYIFNGVRAEGGEFMQTCYGPEEAMDSTIAAYTPNIIWYNDENYSYSKKGGGTSSATPQVAAAAAIWLQKYKSIIEEQLIDKSERWRIVEAVRRALFLSAKKIPQYQKYYGNGMLKAYDALSYTPVESEARSPEFYIDVNALEMSPPADLGITALDEIAEMFITRSHASELTDSQRKTYEQMLATEISQLAMMDAQIMSELDPEMSLDLKKLSQPLVTAIINSDYSSQHLKMAMASYQDSLYKDRMHNDPANLILEKTKATLDLDVTVRGQNVAYTITEDVEFVDSYAQDIIDIPHSAFKIEIQSTRLRSDSMSELNIYTKYDENSTSVAFISEHRNGMMYHYWKIIDEEKRGLFRGAQYGRQLSLLGPHQMRGNGVKEFFVKVFKLSKNVIKNMRKNSRSLALDLKQRKPKWNNISRNELNTFTQSNNLLMLHGTFNSPQGSFEHLIKNEDFIRAVIEKYNGIILAADMPTLTHDVETNANYLRNFKSDQQTVIASSRGCLVAREAFKLNYSSPQKLILSAGPHFGTPILNIIGNMALINRLSNLAILSFGTIGPVIGGILKVLGLITKHVTNLPGLSVQGEGNPYLEKLNNGYDFDDERLLLIGSDFNPSESQLMKLINWMIDYYVFNGRKNDGLVPTKGALGIQEAADYDKPNRLLIPTTEGISHMEYFKNKRVVEAIIKKMS